MAPIDDEDFDDSEEELPDGSEKQMPSMPEVKAKLSADKAGELLKTGMACKEAGLGAYKTGNFKKAIECWSVSSTNLQQLKEDGLVNCTDPDSDLTMEKVMELDLVTNLNLAQAHLKDGTFQKALGFCEAG